MYLFYLYTCFLSLLHKKYGTKQVSNWWHQQSHWFVMIKLFIEFISLKLGQRLGANGNKEPTVIDTNNAINQWVYCLEKVLRVYTVKPALVTTCPQRPPVYKDHIFSFPWKWFLIETYIKGTCLQRPLFVFPLGSHYRQVSLYM